MGFSLEMKFFHGCCPVTSKFIYFITLTLLNTYFFFSEVATEEVDHLFASSDDDHDDRLSYDEIINNYDIFVGSEATDYGDHLTNIEHFKDEL